MMRRVDTGHAGKVGLALLMVLVLTLGLAAVVLAEPSAPEAPRRPHAFYGNVATDRGMLFPAGTVLTAKALTGQWSGTATTAVNASGQYSLDVPGADENDPTSGATTGNQIAFYVLGVQARLHDVAAGTWSSTYPFSHGGITELDLSVPISYTITATAGPNGGIAPAGAVQVAYGFDQAFSITPNSNYLILDVLVDGVSNPVAVVAGSYTFTNVTADHAIHATFVKATYVITPTAGTGCTIMPGTPVTVPYKESQSFTMGALAGYDLTDVKVDGVSDPSALATGSYTFSNVQADHTIAATCTKRTYKVYLPLVMR